MGVYIKGMEMPKGDELLCINIFPNGNVTMHFDLRCEPVATAVPVPEHGRLIDADVLLKQLEEGSNQSIGQAHYTYSFASAYVRNAHTIIPASEEGEG